MEPLSYKGVKFHLYHFVSFKVHTRGQKYSANKGAKSRIHPFRYNKGQTWNL